MSPANSVLAHSLGLGRRRIFLIVLCSLTFFACSGGPNPAWSSPASQDLLVQLEAKSLDPGASAARRSQLFFLWGQELASQSRQPPNSGAPGNPSNQGAAPSSAADPGELRRRAIGAFSKVIDLQAGLVDESRFNLEILLKEEARQDQNNQQDQDKQDKQDKENPDKKDQESGQDQQKQDKNSGKDQKKPADKDPKSGQDQKTQAKDQGSQPKDQKAADPRKDARDLSSLVKDKSQDASLEQAVKQENSRKSQEQAIHTGVIVPVEKDW